MSTENNLKEKIYEEPSVIQEFFKGTKIFITGGSGFLGNLLIQKLIRSCPDLNKIYIMMRAKKGKSAETRLEDMFQDIVFKRMKNECPDYMKKVKIILGDLERADLGITEGDKSILFEEVNIIFHIAASVRFDEKIKKASRSHLKATRDLLGIAKYMTNLKAFVYCSTAYSNYPREEIDEQFYEMPYSPDRLLQITDLLFDEELDILTPTLIGNWPNTYTFTKGMTEIILKEEGKGLPITILRPSMAMSTVSDPLGGWINNLYGPVGVSSASGLGVLRVIQAKKEKIADIVPGDYVAHNMIAAAHHIGTTFYKDETKSNDNLKTTEENMVIFNCISGAENPMTWGSIRDMGYSMLEWAPIETLWFYVILFPRSELVASIQKFYLHTIPAYLLDFVLLLTGRETRMVKIATKVNYLTGLLKYFTTREWRFKNDNNQALWNNLNSTDRKLFPFSIKELDWKTYFLTKYGRGMYLYVFKNDEERLPEAQSRYNKLKYLHYGVVYGFYTICLLLIIRLIKMFL